MEYELEINYDKSIKKVKITPSVYVNNKAVFQVISNEKTVVLFKDETGGWRTTTNGLINDDLAQKIGHAIEQNLGVKS